MSRFNLVYGITGTRCRCDGDVCGCHASRCHAYIRAAVSHQIQRRVTRSGTRPTSTNTLHLHLTRILLMPECLRILISCGYHWYWKQWGILEKQEWITLLLMIIPLSCVYDIKGKPPKSAKNDCEIFCIDHTNYCWHARHIGSGSVVVSVNQPISSLHSLIWPMRGQIVGAPYHNVTPTAAP